jgi:hypothetical protein
VSEQMQGEIANLNTEIEQADCPRAGFALVQARIKAIRQSGKEVPSELTRIERNLQAECISQSRGG